MAKFTTFEEAGKKRTIEADGLIVWRSDEVPPELLEMARTEQERMKVEQEEKARKEAAEDKRRQDETIASWDRAMIDLVDKIPAAIRDHIDPDPLIREAIDARRKPGMYDYFEVSAPGVAPFRVYPWFLQGQRIMYRTPSPCLKDEAEYWLTDGPDELPEPEDAIAIEWQWAKNDDTEDPQRALYLAIHAEVDARAMIPSVEKKRADYAAKVEDLKRSREERARAKAKREAELEEEAKLLAEFVKDLPEEPPEPFRKWRHPSERGLTTDELIVAKLERIAAALEQQIPI